MAIREIAPDLFRISTYVPEFNLQFNQFLIRDDEPLLFHTGMRVLFPVVREEVARVLEPSRIRWIGFSHFESDECGALNDWLEIAPRARAVCSFVGAAVSVNDFAARPAHAMTAGQMLSTGKYRLQFLHTPHVPHCWEAGLMFEETQGTLLCSDLFTHQGDVESQTTSDVVGRFKAGLIGDLHGPFANAYPYTDQTGKTLKRLAALNPRTLAIMHGSAFTGDGKQAIDDLASVMHEVLAN
ncbi:MAG: MBL fold metallo-hydrolase [Gammaproteobacteria bacterium]